MARPDGDPPNGSSRSKRDPEMVRRGKRLRDLRVALNFTQEDVENQTIGIAEQLGVAYPATDRRYLSAVENGRLHLTTAPRRIVLCRMFHVTMEELDDCLEGKVSPELLAQLARARLAGGAEAPPSGTAPRGAAMLRWGDHPRWSSLVAEARSIDPDVSSETMDELRESPFLKGDLQSLDAQLLAQVARALQSWRRRAGAKPDTRES